MIRTPSSRIVYSSLALVLLAPCLAIAEETNPEWQGLILPTSQIELGLGFVRGGTPMFHTATGTDPGKHHVIGNLDLRSSTAYDSEAMPRWRVFGRQLGLENHELSGEYFVQGRYGLTFSLDRLSRATTESYQTPFLGAGGTALTLPAGLIQASTNPQTGAVQLAANVHPFTISLRRQKADLGGSFWLTPHWEFRGSFREEKQDGVRASGAPLGMFGAPPNNIISMILPEPVRTTTRSLEASLGYQAPGKHVHMAYRGSFFLNDIDGYSFQNPFTALNTLINNRMGSAPDNQAHKISLAGGYTFGPKARISASAAYGRLTQNEPFLPYSSAAGSPPLPRSSLDGLVVTRQWQLKLASRPFRNWRINALYKSDGRDNRTPVSAYTLPGVSAAQTGEVGSANYIASNIPYSRNARLGQVEAGVSWRPGSDLLLMAQRETIARYCNDRPGCTEVPKSRENTWRMELRQDIADGIIGRIGFSAAERLGSDYQRFADSVGLAGMRKYSLADRRRSQLRAGLNASLTDALSAGVVFDANRDRYVHSPYGLQASDSQALTLDLGFAITDDLSVSAFLTREAIDARLANSYSTVAVGGIAQEVPGAQWQARMSDDINTAGVTLKHRDLLSGKLELDGDLVVVRARSAYQISGGPYSATTSPLALLPSALPDVTSRSLDARINARYRLDGMSSLRLTYLYRRLTGADFALDLYSIGTLNRLLGTGETTPRHSVQFFGIGYQYSFR